MRITTDRGELASALAWCQRGIPSRLSVPILAGVNIEVTDAGALTLSTFDYEAGHIARVAGDDSEPGKILVTCADLARMVKALPKGKRVRVTLAATWPEPVPMPEQPDGELHDYTPSNPPESSWRTIAGCSCGWTGATHGVSADAKNEHDRHVTADAPLVAAWRKAAANAATFRPGTLTVTSGPASSRLTALDDSEYPALPELPDATGTIAGVAFSGAVQRVARAAGRDDTLPTLTGVRIAASDRRLEFAATDRYRMHIESRSWIPAGDLLPAGVKPADSERVRRVVVPWRSLTDFAKAAGTNGKITVHLPAHDADQANGALAGFSCDRYSMTVRALTGEFPRIEKFATDYMDKDAPDSIECDAAALLDAVTRTGKQTDRTHGITVTWQAGALTVATRDYESEYSEQVSAPHGPDGYALRLGFNADYLAGALAGITGTARLGMFGAAKPVTVTAASGAAFRSLVMQYRLGDDATHYRRCPACTEDGHKWETCAAADPKGCTCCKTRAGNLTSSRVA